MGKGAFPAAAEGLKLSALSAVGGIVPGVAVAEGLKSSALSAAGGIVPGVAVAEGLKSSALDGGGAFIPALTGVLKSSGLDDGKEGFISLRLGHGVGFISIL